MTITLTDKELTELWLASTHNNLKPEREPFEIFHEMPTRLGKGYERHIEVHPNLWLSVCNYEYHDDMSVKSPERNHPLQFGVLLSGKVMDKYGGQVGEGYSCISGGGVQRQMITESPKSRYVGVNIHMSPDLLATFFPDEAGEIPQQLRLLAKGNGEHLSFTNS